MEHTSGGDLFLTCGCAGNHETFRCEIPGASIDDVLRLLQICQDEFVHEILGYRWSCGNKEDPSRPDLGKQMYDWLVAAGFPLQSAEVEFTCELTNLRALDGLKALCGPDGDFRTVLWSFQLPNGHHAAVHVQTRRDGHYLILNLPLPEDLPLVQSILHLPLGTQAAVV